MDQVEDKKMVNESLSDKQLLDNIGKIAFSLDKTYISKLSSDYRVLYFDKKNEVKPVYYDSNVRAVKVKRWVFNRDEKPGECFKNVLSTFADGDHTIALVVKRTSIDTEMYFVIKNEGEGRNEDSRENVELLNSSIKGNFQGSECTIINDPDEIEKLFSFKNEIKLDNIKKDFVSSIAILANTPSKYSDDYIGQGLDKLLNGVIPKSEAENYIVIFLAESLTLTDIRNLCSGYEEIATAIGPYLQYQFQTGITESNTHGEMESISDTESISDSLSKTHSINFGSSISSDIFGVSLSGGYGYSWGKSHTITNSKTNTKGTSNSLSIGKSKGTTYTYKSYLVAGLLTKLEETIKRINKSQSIGLWKYSTYVLGSNSKITKNVANYLKGITQGRESYNEPAIVQEWSKKESYVPTDFEEIKKYISHFTHPIFITKNKEDKSTMMLTPTSYVSTEELSHVVVFPKKSLQGLPVLEGVEFGREPHSLISTDADLEIGSGYHMHHVVENQRIKLSKEELTKHTFVTGTTGSGKSNTIYKMLGSLSHQDVKFLVVEPTKGEYKDVFGGREDVRVFGTNPYHSELLRLNPFSFPEGIHILEHIDRLIEIFNVCWPMYAAMPAVLKEAVERAYQSVGWDLTTSQCKYKIKNRKIYPNFVDVLTQVNLVINSSKYSADSKGDYIGALSMRIGSLTNGINGLILSSDELSNETLFDSNVIVDLSRVGSVETKSLLMGLIILKLQEYRMVSSKCSNEGLRHITVLEEAHHLLKRTSTEQSSESSNLVGKSVEMITNAIAEMRTYGEGFIIVDQSPGLLDMAAIRNTNTKIILRLPDYSDRELVGRAAGLSENQIVELAKLEKGVAAISQSDWLEPVLCKIDKWVERNSNKCKEVQSDIPDSTMIKRDIIKFVLQLITTMKKEPNNVIENIIKSADKIMLSSELKLNLLNLNQEKDIEMARILGQSIIYEIFSPKIILEKNMVYKDEIEKWMSMIEKELIPSLNDFEKDEVNKIIFLLILEEMRLSGKKEYDDLNEKFLYLLENERRKL